MPLANYLKYTFFTVIFFLTRLAAFCQDKTIPQELYIAATIPDSLKEGANSVVRYSDIIRTVESPAKENFKVHKIVTVFK